MDAIGMEPRMMVAATAPLAVRPRTENTARDVHGADVLGPPLGAAGEVQTVIGLEAAPDHGGSTSDSTDPGSAGTATNPGPSTGRSVGEDASYAAFARAHRSSSEHAPGSFPWDRNRDGWVDDPATLLERQHEAQVQAARQAAAAEAARSESAPSTASTPVPGIDARSAAGPTESPPVVVPGHADPTGSIDAGAPRTPTFDARPLVAPSRSPELHGISPESRPVPDITADLPPAPPENTRPAPDSTARRPDPSPPVAVSEPSTVRAPARPEPVVARYSAPAPAAAPGSPSYL